MISGTRIAQSVLCFIREYRSSFHEGMESENGRRIFLAAGHHSQKPPLTSGVGEDSEIPGPSDHHPPFDKKGEGGVKV
jgi:hypothetical protein